MIVVASYNGLYFVQLRHGSLAEFHTRNNNGTSACWMIREIFPLENLNQVNSWKIFPSKKTRYTVHKIDIH